MTTRLGRRTLAGAAALLPAFGFLNAARAQPANETTFDRVRRTKTLRIAVLPGELPYFSKDLASGESREVPVNPPLDLITAIQHALQ